MPLPIFSYGHPVLTKQCNPVDPGYPELNTLIDNMWDTMYSATGAGLSASQIGKPLQLFVVDSRQTYNAMNETEKREYFHGDSGIKETFINACITYTSANKWTDTEGCLSMPGLDVEVERPWTIKVEYMDADFQQKKKEFSGLTARMIQHEFDHTRGILFLRYLSQFKRTLLDNKLDSISRGEVPSSYPMQFLKTSVA